jgi:DNA repair protein RecO (recombination protein O)
VSGAALITPALVLGTVRYGETSRIVRLATREQGVVSAIAKGALRPRSRFGAALQLFSEGQAHLIPSRSSDLHTLAAFDLAALHQGLATPLDRFAAASALAELAARFVPPLANPELYDMLRDEVALLALTPPSATAVVALRALWRLIGELGLGPALHDCARDGAPVGSGGAAFSVRDGGFLCASCGARGATTRLAASDREALIALIEPEHELPVLSDLQAAAHRRLLVRWVQGHLGETAMPALEFWHHPRVGTR